MPFQTMYVKSKGGKGTVAVQIVRTFKDASGEIFQHHNGVFGDKAGNPVKSEDDLQVLPEPFRRIALAWWNRIGKKLSQAYYDKVAQEDAARAGDFQDRLAAEEYNSQLDGILYVRKAVMNGKPNGAATAPQSWLEYGFSARPDWWGQADKITFRDFAYAMFIETGDDPQSLPAQESSKM